MTHAAFVTKSTILFLLNCRSETEEKLEAAEMPQEEELNQPGGKEGAEPEDHGIHTHLHTHTLTSSLFLSLCFSLFFWGSYVLFIHLIWICWLDLKLE